MTPAKRLVHLSLYATIVLSACLPSSSHPTGPHNDDSNAPASPRQLLRQSSTDPKTLTYFTEDIGLNSYFYYLNVDSAVQIIAKNRQATSPGRVIQIQNDTSLALCGPPGVTSKPFVFSTGFEANGLTNRMTTSSRFVCDANRLISLGTAKNKFVFSLLVYFSETAGILPTTLSIPIQSNSANVTEFAGPNGSIDWLNCGITSETGWHPPFVRVTDIVAVNLSQAVTSPASPFKRCAPFIALFEKYGRTFGSELEASFFFTALIQSCGGYR